MASVVFYFHVHQPFRLAPFDAMRIGEGGDYFQWKGEMDDRNVKVLRKVAKKCYLPTNRVLARLLDEIEDFKVSFSITGVVLEQFEKYAPEVLESFMKLVKTGKVELVGDTYHHSLAFVFSRREFREQVRLHQKRVKELFGVETKSFRNTELIYNNDVAKAAEEMGFTTVLAEGVDRYLDWRSPNFVYKPKGTRKIRLLLKNYRLSDDIAFRFSNRGWKEWPLTAEKYAKWINQVNGNGYVVNLFMDYETFGEHQWQDTGIFEFLTQLPREIKKCPDNTFMTVGEAAWNYKVADEVDMPELTSWADIERDLSAWLENPLQQSASRAVYELEEAVRKSKRPELLDVWRKLTTSDHYYYMCTKWFSDGDVHKYFSPHESPYVAYNNFMNVLHDLRERVYTEL